MNRIVADLVVSINNQSLSDELKWINIIDDSLILSITESLSSKWNDS